MTVAELIEELKGKPPNYRAKVVLEETNAEVTEVITDHANQTVNIW